MNKIEKETKQAWIIEGANWNIRVEEVVVDLPQRKDGRYTTRWVGSTYGRYTPESAMFWSEADAIKHCLESLNYIKSSVENSIEECQKRLAELES